ncbi:MAG: glyceraldehyde 3-phosphate dehydrogenase NAD-binding domain-containing protein [Acidimicrobiales bacterium]
MTARIAINGFGRIGRSFVRAALERPGLVDVIAVNDTNDPLMLAYLLQHDTVQGMLDAEVKQTGEMIQIDDLSVALSHEPDPARLPWARHGIDVVIESTGRFTTADEAGLHIAAGADRVIISAPATGADLTVCMGVNHESFDADHHVVLSNASCTTNCLAPMAYVLHQSFVVLDGFMSTVHAYRTTRTCSTCRTGVTA